MSEVIAFEDLRLAVTRADIATPGGTLLASLAIEAADGKPRGTVLLPATYGKRQEAFCAMAISLAINGWRVVRFDLRNNEGASPGGIYGFCFLSMIEDIVHAARYVHARHGAFLLVATSLAARAAIRALPAMPAPDRSVFILPVVHAGATVDHASDAKPYRKWTSGVDRDVATGDAVDGFLVNRGFIARAIEADLLSLESTARELGEIGPTVSAIFSVDDAWICAAEAEATFAQANAARAVRGAPPHRLWFIDGVSHELGKNPVLFRQVFGILAGELAPERRGELRHAPFRLIAETIRAERSLLRTTPAAAEAGVEVRLRGAEAG